MLRFRIHMVFKGRYRDHVDLTGDTAEEIQEQAKLHIENRKPASYWSEDISPKA